MANYSDIFPVSISSGSANIAGFEWEEKTADFVATANKAYYIDTALGDALMELPPSPSPGDEVGFLIIGANKANITSTDKIKGSLLATDYVKQAGEQYLLFIFSYVDGTTGWNWDSRYDSYIGNGYLGEQDPLLANVVLFLKMDGANEGTTFTDSSPLGLTVTRVGASPPTTSTARAKYGTSSGLFEAANSYLSVNHASLALGTDTFCIEFWGYKTSVSSANDGAFTYGTNNTTFAGPNVSIYNSNIYPLSGSNNSGDAFPINQWNHIALVREGTGTNQFKTYLNGNEIWAGTVSTNYTQTFCLVGLYAGATFCWDGNLSHFRITKGNPRYTANFNPELDTYLNL